MSDEIEQEMTLDLSEIDAGDDTKTEESSVDDHGGVEDESGSDHQHAQDVDDVEEVDLSSVDIDPEPGARPESDDEARKHNRHHASMRVKLKQKERELEELRQAKEAGYSAEDPKPKRTDFMSETALYDKYSGNADRARAAYEDALEDWQERARSRHMETMQKLNAEVEREKYALDVQDQFDRFAEPVKKKVKGFDSCIERAEKALTIPDGAGGTLDGSLMIKEHYGEDAPLILAAIGANKKIADRVLHAKTAAQVHVILGDVRASAKRAIMTKKQTVSRAPGERPVKGDAQTPLTALQKALQKAADNRDLKEYQRLQRLIAEKRKK